MKNDKTQRKFNFINQTLSRTTQLTFLKIISVHIQTQ